MGCRGSALAQARSILVLFLIAGTLGLPLLPSGRAGEDHSLQSAGSQSEGAGTQRRANGSHIRLGASGEEIRPCLPRRPLPTSLPKACYASWSGTHPAGIQVERLAAPGAGQPPNRHPAADEGFYTLDGTFEFDIGTRTHVARAGDLVTIPRGEVHTFRNIGQVPARVLIINAPGQGPCRLLLTSQAADAARGRKLLSPPGPPDISRLLEIRQRSGIEFLLPRY